MTRVADLLRDGDPAASDRDMSEADARRMREQVLAHHARRRAERGAVWQGALVLASAVAAAVAVGTWLGDANAIGPSRATGGLAVARVPEPPPPRQVQFVTPRGTRVVWVLQAETPDQSDQEGVR